MASGFEYRKVLYTDYYENQSGRAFDLQVEAKMQRDESLFRNEFFHLLPNNKDAAILDIGCGFGSLVLALKKLNYTNVKGIDLSESQVKVAHQFGLTEVQIADIHQYLADKPNHFDLITGIDIIEHFSKDELIDLLQIIKRSLKPGGKAIFRTPNNDAPMATIYSRGDFTHENYMNASSANQLMLSLGFQRVSVSASHMETEGAGKELIRKLTWAVIEVGIRLLIFATARSSKNVILTPNMIIKVEN
jgi:SAM-dependent methyltransferase